MMVQKKFHSDGTKKVPHWWYKKWFLMMTLKMLYSDGTEMVTKYAHFICQVSKKS